MPVSRPPGSVSALGVRSGVRAGLCAQRLGGHRGWLSRWTATTASWWTRPATPEPTPTPMMQTTRTTVPPSDLPASTVWTLWDAGDLVAVYADEPTAQAARTTRIEQEDDPERPGDRALLERTITVAALRVHPPSQAAVTADQAATYPDGTTIRLWRFDEAPEQLRLLSGNGGDEDWVIAEPVAAHADGWHRCCADDLAERVAVCDADAACPACTGRTTSTSAEARLRRCTSTGCCPACTSPVMPDRARCPCCGSDLPDHLGLPARQPSAQPRPTSAPVETCGLLGCCTHFGHLPECWRAGHRHHEHPCHASASPR